MKLIFAFLVGFSLVSTIVAQDFKQRASENLPYLIRDSILQDQILITDKGVTIFASNEDRAAGKPEATIVWKEVPTFLNLLENYTIDEVVDRYLAKGTSSFDESQYYALEPQKKKPVSLRGMKIAIDPGHNANRFENAVIERKFMKIKGEALGLEHDIQFFESDLAYETAAILRKRLKKEGAIILMSRKRGQSAAGMNFDKWLKKGMNRDLKKDFANEILTQEQYNWYKDKATTSERFRYYFNRKDLRTRADKINAFKPDITLIIHYNASGAKMVDGYHEPTEKNYSMAFVGGGFMKGELKKPIDRVHFLRLLLSQDLRRSIELCEVFMQQHESILMVPAIENKNNLPYLNKNSVYVGKAGVYARNLFLTRHITGAIVFGESFLQDNVEEAKRLHLVDHKEKGIKTSSRIGEAVETYYQTVLKYIGE